MIYLELVPNNIPDLIKESKWALNSFKDIYGINVPDILRIDNRSYDAVTHLAKEAIPCIPHIRICDFSIDNLLSLCNTLQDNNVDKILLISGDPPPNPLQPIFKHNIVNVIKTITSTMPKLTIYAGHDPYRQSFKEEFNYSKKKLEAGAKGLFTQPIFDTNLTNILLDQCLPCEWFIGISPVLTEKSFNYWVSRNNVVFPPDFKLSLDYNTKIAKEIITICKEKNQHNYIMPITCDIKPYLSNICHEKNN
ncbi:methylenetetrahydrofolate reductase [Candidatus Marinamargulisbacteria bacterium SCGC AG-343-K17]|nr:methylenetetrahydrofolate reductase [Candidatus Marinamargulisbacteria bacterium SCGC AG-343-K17]